MAKRINVLWLDDDLHPIAEGKTDERERLQAWLRWFATGVRREQFFLIEAQSIESFAAHLKSRAFLKPEHDDYVHAILVDTMWKHHSRSETTFAAIGFPDESIISLEAGAQLIGFMRSTKHAKTRSDWLDQYSKRDMAVLTTLTDSNGALHDHVGDAAARNSFAVIHKKTVGGTGVVTDLLEPDAIWLEWIDNIRKRFLTIGQKS